MTYPSRRGSIASISEEVACRISEELPGRPLLAVTHSMGGIILRHLSDRFDWQGCVLVAPPNAGSRAARLAHRLPPVRWFLGPALAELGHPVSWPDLPKPNLVISGTRGVSWLSPPSWLFAMAGLFEAQERHDGTLVVEETRHDLVDEYAELPAGHSTIMSHRGVIDKAVAWLDTRRSSSS